MHRLAAMIAAILALLLGAVGTAQANGSCIEGVIDATTGSLSCAENTSGVTTTDKNPAVPTKPGPPPKPEPIPGCATPINDPDFCIPKDTSGNPINIPATAATAALSLQIPEPTIALGPNPAHNKWNMIPIGFPLWVWTTEPDTLHATTTQQGITITMTATRGPTTINFGDGTTITCHTMTPRPKMLNPPPPSPDCGHTYTTKATYQISATTTWTITWDALGFTGTIPITRTNTTPLRIGEISSVLVQGP